MRKQRRQPSFATLTDAEIEQIAQSLDGAIYADIRARVNKPRSEGGYGLNLTTDRPLELLWKRTKTVEKINTHITQGKKLTLATFEEITAGDSGPCGEHPATDQIHDAILFESMESVRSGENSPHQLLALQRLADFPARAELREQNAQIRAQTAQDLSRLRKQALAHRTERNQIVRAKEARAQAKAQREAEMHTHKINRDLCKFDPTPCNADNLSARSRDAMDSTDAAVDLTPANTESLGESATQHSELRTQHASDVKRFPTPNPLPHEIYLKNCAYTEKLLAGLVDPLTGRVLDEPDSNKKLTDSENKPGTAEVRPVSPSGPSSRNDIKSTAAPADQNATDIQNSSAPSDPKSDHDSRSDRLSSGTILVAGLGSQISNQKPEMKPLTEEEITALIPHVISPRPLPPEVIRANIRYAEKVRTGKIIIDRSGPWVRAIELPDTTENVAASSIIENTSTSADTKSEIKNRNSEIEDASNLQLSTTENPSSPSASSAPSALIPTIDLAATVDTYTVHRCREYIAHSQKYTPWPHRHSPPEYITQFRHCPCGQATPCPVHESEEFGTYPNIFWKISPFAPAYVACLRDRNLPYREPKEYLP